MSFKPNRELLNPNFEGYKLSEKPLSFIQQSFTGGVYKICLQEKEQFSFERMYEATMCNHLIQDPWDGRKVYWIENKTQNITSGSLIDSSVVISTEYCNSSSFSYSTNASLFFLSDSLSLYYHSTQLLIFNTGIRTTAPISPWQLVTSIPLSTHEVTLQAVRLNETQLDLLTFCIIDTPTKYCEWNWIRVTFPRPLAEGTTANDDIVQKTCCIFTTNTLCNFSQFNGEYLLLLSDCKPETKGEREECKKDEMETEETSYHGIGYKDQLHTWTQSESDVTVTVNLPQDVTKHDIIVTVEKSWLLVGLSDGVTFVRGVPWESVKTCTWTMSDGVLDVVIEKMSPGVMWSSLLKDTNNDLPLQDLTSDHLTNDELTDINKTLNDMRRKRQSPSKGSSASKQVKDGPIFTSQLEECDHRRDDEKEQSLYVLSSDGNVIQKCGLGGKQVLFSFPSVICLKHDIDALLFSLSSPLATFTHTNTLHALAYVQASKSDKKFLTSDGYCTVLTDASRHVFVYVHIVGNYAPQYIHTLSHDAGNILGVQVTSERNVFVLTDNSLTVLLVK